MLCTAGSKSKNVVPRQSSFDAADLPWMSLMPFISVCVFLCLYFSFSEPYYGSVLPCKSSVSNLCGEHGLILCYNKAIICAQAGEIRGSSVPRVQALSIFWQQNASR